MASSASTMREPRTSVVAWACEARRLPTAAVQAATANCSVEIASDNFSFARDFPARSIRTEFKFSILVKEVTVTLLVAWMECFQFQTRDRAKVTNVAGGEN